MNFLGLLVALATVATGILIATRLRGAAAKMAIFLLVVFTMFAGPWLYGKDWYYQGFFAGLVLGDFVGVIFGGPRRRD